MNRREDIAIERLDRSRLAPGGRALRDARKRVIRLNARQVMREAANDYDCETERAAFLCDCLDMVAEHLHPLMGRVEAATAFNSRAADICGPLQFGRAQASAAAEHAFARLTAANDKETTS